MTYLDITSPDPEGNFPIINEKKEIIGTVSQKAYIKNPGKYMTDEITPFTYTGYRGKKKSESKIKRCKCK